MTTEANNRLKTIPTTPLHYYVISNDSGILMDTHTLKQQEAAYWAQRLRKVAQTFVEASYSVIATSREISV